MFGGDFKPDPVIRAVRESDVEVGLEVAEREGFERLETRQPMGYFFRMPTRAESQLWQSLRNRQLGFHFRRQHPIERFIVDFYCSKAKLVVEIDGQIHAGRSGEDRTRDAFIESSGFRVLRFKNEQVLEDLDGVLQGILAALATSPPAAASPSPPAERGIKGVRS